MDTHPNIWMDLHIRRRSQLEYTVKVQIRDMYKTLGDTSDDMWIHPTFAQQQSHCHVDIKLAMVPTATTLPLNIDVQMILIRQGYKV